MKIIKDIPYRQDCKEQKLDLYLPDQDHFSTLVYFHGGGLESGSKEGAEIFASYLTERKIAVASVEYRMYPKAKYPDFITDCASASAWVHKNIQNYGGNEKIFLSGSSAGGYLTMMLCFDPGYLEKEGLTPFSFTAFIHDAGQPTKHFNVLREMGLDTRRVIVDETSPLYHIGLMPDYPPMHFIVSDQDMENRYEQTMLVLSTLRHFGFEKATLRVMHGTHCAYVGQLAENGESVFGQMLFSYIQSLK